MLVLIIGLGTVVLLAGLFLIARIKRQQIESKRQESHTQIYGQFVKSNRFKRQAGKLSSNAVSERSESLNVAQHPTADSVNKSKHDSNKNREVGLMDEESKKLEDDFLETNNELGAFQDSRKPSDVPFETNLSSTTPAKQSKNSKSEKAGFWSRLFRSKTTTQKRERLFSEPKPRDPANITPSTIAPSQTPASAADISNPSRPARFRPVEANHSHDKAIDVDPDQIKEPNESIPDSDSDSIVLTSDEYNFEIKNEDLSDLFTKPNDPIINETNHKTQLSSDADELLTIGATQHHAEPSPQEVDKPQKQFEQARKKIEELETELRVAQDLQHQLLSAQQEREDLIAQLSAAEKSNQQLVDQLETLQANQIQNDESKQLDQQQIDQLQRQCELDQQQIDELNQRFERQIQQLQKQSELDRQRIEELQSEIQKQGHLNEELSNLRQQHEQAIADLSTTETSNRELMERLNLLQVSQLKFTELQQQALLSEQKIAELEQQLSKAQAFATFTNNSTS